MLGEVSRELFDGEPRCERRVQAHRVYGWELVASSRSFWTPGRGWYSPSRSVASWPRNRRSSKTRSGAMGLEDYGQVRGRLYCAPCSRGISGLAERLVDDEMRVEIWCKNAAVCDAAGRRFRLAGVPEMYADGCVCMMRAFGKWIEVGLIIALSHSCPANARGHSSHDGL